MPDTTTYLIMALLVTSGLIGGFIATMRLRYLNAKKTMRLIQQLSNE